MLTVLVGSNTSRRNERLQSLLSPHKKNDADIIFYNDVNFNADLLRAKAESSSLFGGASIVVVSGIADSTALRDELENIIPLLSESQQYFFISENTLPASFKKLVEKSEGIVEEFEEKNKTKKEEAFNVFLLTDAFSARKRAQTWALYRQAINLGVEPRELHGKIFWAVKNMMLVYKTKSAKEAGLHPFVYEKSKGFAQNFKEAELEKMSGELTTLFHETMLDGTDFEIVLESFLLRTLSK